MKHLADLLLLGDPRLYETCEPIRQEELPLVAGWVADLHNVMEEIRATYQFGRGIAAPQLGIMKRLFYLNVTGPGHAGPQVIINPEIVQASDEMNELWDDCMSFPNLLVRVKRHRSLTLRYRDEHWQEHTWTVTDWAMSELIQHEYDHLNGVLCTMRAIDPQSFRWRPTPTQPL
ncbi:peptide deformylase [Fibrisoma montanum]|uniref:Peptide deformylase n=1 Tax=Fibrisoma montanum TaxID=2305895 RepID=A0A418MB56_9BACT|nr:peptide deformylase [Fibrisoma montanum]RIV23584.1 peptide deformylase [Fibrisoma montanum]